MVSRLKLSAWEIWDEQFTRRLSVEEYPISVLVDASTPFASMRVGLVLQNGGKIILDYAGTTIQDPSTGECLAGITSGRDITSITRQIKEMREIEQDKFKVIVEMMPQLVWTCTPDGYADSFNTRWENHTGQCEKDALGHGWLNVIHPDDIKDLMVIWKASVDTGSGFQFEYRMRRRDGVYRWMLARAAPFVDKATGNVNHWFGTDVPFPETPRVTC
jgi:PAS domain S-box-containing protein